MVNVDLLQNFLYGFVFIFDGSAVLYVLYCILKNVLVFKVYGLKFFLLVMIEVAVVLFLTCYGLDFSVSVIN